MQYQVFILDDHTAVAKGLEMELRNDSINITSGNCLSSLIKRVNDGNIDLLILDYELKEETALNIIPLVRKTHPYLPIIIYTMHSEPWILSLLIKQGVSSIVEKSDKLDEITKAVHQVLFEHEKYYSPTALNAMATILGDQTAKVGAYMPSKRELEVINLLSHGLTSEELSIKTCLSKNTIDTIRKNILLKSGAANSLNLMRMAFIKGWINS